MSNMEIFTCLYIWTGKCFKLVSKHILFSGMSDASMKRHINTGITITNSVCYCRTHRGEPLLVLDEVKLMLVAYSKENPHGKSLAVWRRT